MMASAGFVLKEIDDEMVGRKTVKAKEAQEQKGFDPEPRRGSTR